MDGETRRWHVNRLNRQLKEEHDVNERHMASAKKGKSTPRIPKRR